MRRNAKLFPTLILLTAGMLWATAVPGESSSPVTPTKAAPVAAVKAAGPSQASSLAPAGLAHVSRVSVQEAQGGGETVIQVATDREPAYKVFQLNGPARLVVDLEGARNDSHQWKVLADSPYVSRVRLGRFSEKDGGVLRIVADLTGNPAIDVHAVAGGIQIELRSREAATKQAPPAAGQVAKAPLRTETVPSQAADLKPAGSDRSEAQTPKTAKQLAPAPARTSVAHAAYQSTLPGASARQEAVASPKPEPAGESSEAATAQKAAKVMAGSVEAASPAVPGQTLSSGSEKAPQYTGEPISLNLKDVDLKDFFRLIHEISGLNIIVDPDVTGSVTMVLDSVPWDQALDIVLKNNGLGKQLEGNVLRIAKISTLTAEQEEAKKLAMAKIDAEPLVTVFRPISYAKATIIAGLLKSWVGGGALSSRGSVLVDDRTNTLIISDIQQQIPLIQDVITKLDKKSAQISIEARVIRVTSDFARNLSTALAFATHNASQSTIYGGASGNNVGGTTTTPPLVTTATAGGFGVFVLSNASSRYAINSAIAAAETRDEAKIISRPSVVTQNNTRATVIQGTQIPIQTTINNTISVTFVQASLQLEVTPQVTNDGNIFLSINISNNSPGPALTNVAPTINTQSATTEVLVPDGGTVVFGGVTVTQRSKSVTQVPLLGSIPVLGHLFKNSSTTSNDQELLFFVTPKILTT